MDDRIYEDNEQLRAYRKNEELKVYRKYCDNLCLDNLCVLSVDDYYESLKDRSKFKEPRDTSKRDAKRDAQITFKSRFRCFFLKDETECKKREKEKQLQSEYKQRHQEDVNRKRAEFEENQRQNHKLMDEMKSKYIKGDKEQIINLALRTKSWTGGYQISPNFRLYSIGLKPWRDSLMRFSRYQIK